RRRRPQDPGGCRPTQRVPGVDDERGRRESRPAREGGLGMSVIVTNETRLCVSGITGSEGTFHTLNNKRYGTNVVSGVTPGKGGQDVEGIPVFNTFAKAVDETG